MKQILIVLALSVVAFGQTKISSPLTVAAPPGGSNTSIIELTPATTAAPCVSVAGTDKTYALCGQNNQITVDFGAGAGYVPLTGSAGPAGPQGIPGPVGPTGPAGPAGTIQATITCTSLTVGSTGVVLSGCH